MGDEKQELRLGQKLLRQSIDWAIDNKCQAIVFDFSEPQLTTIKYNKNGALSKKLHLSGSAGDSLAAQLKIAAKHSRDWQPAEQLLKIRRLNGKTWKLDLVERPRQANNLQETFMDQQARKRLQQQLLKPSGLILIVSPQQADADYVADLILQLYDSDKYHLASLGTDRLKTRNLDQLQLNCQEPGIADAGLRFLAELAPDAAYLSLGQLPLAAKDLIAKSDSNLVLAWLAADDINQAIKQIGQEHGWQSLVLNRLNSAITVNYLPLICPHCRQSFQPDAGLSQELALALGQEQLTIPKVFMSGAGCPHCDHQGFHGSLTILEWQDFSQLKQNSKAQWLQELNNPQQPQLAELALTAALQGLIHLENALQLD